MKSKLETQIERIRSMFPPPVADELLRAQDEIFARALSVSELELVTGGRALFLVAKRGENGKRLLSHPDHLTVFKPAEETLSEMIRELQENPADMPNPPEIPLPPMGEDCANCPAVETCQDPPAVQFRKDRDHPN